MTVKFKKLSTSAVLPTKAHDDDFCYDVVAVSEEEIAPNTWKYGLGFALQSSCKEQGLDTAFTIRPRSSIWKTGMVLSNSVGTIDHGYTGEISVVFYHVVPSMPRYKVGDKVAQIHFEESVPMVFTEVEELDETERGVDGYGSTGR